MSMRFSRDGNPLSVKQNKPIDEDQVLRRKSSSSLSSSLKSSPRNVKHRHSNNSRSSSSNYECRPSQRESCEISDIAENSIASSNGAKRKSRRSQYAGKASRSPGKGKPGDTRSSVRYSQISSNSNGAVLRLKPFKTNGNAHTKTGHRSREEPLSGGTSYTDTSPNDEATSSDYDGSSSSHDHEMEEVVSKRSSSKKRHSSSNNKFQEVGRKLLLLQQRCDLLEKENEHIKKEQQAKNHKKIADLKHRNSELVNVARRLEQKAKSLQQQSEKRSHEIASSSQELVQQKKGFTKLKARMETEHLRLITEKDHQIETLKKQIDDLKKSLHQANTLRFSPDAGDTISASLKQAQRESLQLQKLAAAGSKKVIIRSLSTPVTARQKILEESNRSLRRQISQLEENCRQACSGEDFSDLKTELENLRAEHVSLMQECKNTKIQTVNLESQLQIAKVESSDLSIRLNELTVSYNQLQEDYNTVHEQLSVAIKERDAAINRCKENSNKITNMEMYVRDVNKLDGSGDDHDKKRFQGTKTQSIEAITQYQIALEKLQAKVSELEKQCNEQNETNRLLNEQLIKLMGANSNDPERIFSVPEEENVNNNSTEPDLLPASARPLDNHSSQADGGEEINANDIKPTSASYRPQKNERQNVNTNEQVGNEDTEVEDFVEEELMPIMQNSEVGKLRVYIAKYTYNPYEGPNECPEAELPLVAGDYVYVYGPMDEDGFFEGELMNGRRGLVPSNFLEPVHDKGANVKSSKPDNAGSAKSTSSEVSQSESVVSSASLGNSRLSHRELSDSNSPVLIHGVLPYPKRLSIDKQLSHSLIIGWVPPQLSDDESLSEYHIFVNGEFKTAVSGNKQKAVVENINHDQAYRISVCAVSHWGISDGNLCVLSHGKGADLAPSSVRMEKIGASSARVAWTPSSSQQCHIVTVEEEATDRFPPQLKNPTVMTHAVSPPAYRFTFGNLSPNVPYKVSVNAKGSAEGKRSCTRFTTPQAGPPDPPLSVQVEECQNANHLLITWLPVTLNTMGTSNGVVVKGYGIHVGEARLCEVQSPTVDQCTIRAQTLADAFGQQLSNCPDKAMYRLSTPSSPRPRWNKHIPPSITVKTLAVNGQESDHSDTCVLSKKLFERLTKLITESEKLASPNDPNLISSSKTHKRPPFVHSRDSTDADVSFSSDLSMPGFSAAKLEDENSPRKSDEHRSHPNRTKILQQTRVVPSIEITHDTSSDEEPVQNGFGSRSSSNRSVNKDSDHISRKVNSPKVQVKTDGGKGHKTSYKGSDNDDAASVSSSHTSSSAGGDASKRSKHSPAAHRTSHAIQGRKLQRGESAEYSNPEDYLPAKRTGAQRNLSPSDTKVTQKRSPEQVRQHRHHQHNLKQNMRHPYTGTSDEHSKASCHSSRNVRKHFHPVRPHRSFPRQSTLSSQSGSEIASETEPSYPIDKKRVSLFVALYDYDPQMMSPNADTFDEELSFAEGQLIKVYGTKDEDGFYYGETHTGTRGYVPCNMVSEVEVENMQMLLDLHERGHLPSASPDEDEQDISDDKDRSTSSHGPEVSTNGQQGADAVKARYFTALFHYEPGHMSPNIDADAEIGFSKGDVIIVHGEMDEDGFFKGKLGDKEGLVPSNYLEEISEQQALLLQQKPSKALKPKDFPTSPSPVPQPHQNHGNTVPLRDPPNSQPNFSSTSSNASSHKADNAVSPRKKGGFISKGKKLFKMLGGSQDGKHKR